MESNKLDGAQLKKLLEDEKEVKPLNSFHSHSAADFEVKVGQSCDLR